LELPAEPVPESELLPVPELLLLPEPLLVPELLLLVQEPKPELLSSRFEF
jgi:hypothetical protein